MGEDGVLSPAVMQRRDIQIRVRHMAKNSSSARRLAAARARLRRASAWKMDGGIDARPLDHARELGPQFDRSPRRHVGRHPQGRNGDAVNAPKSRVRETSTSSSASFGRFSIGFAMRLRGRRTN